MGLLMDDDSKLSEAARDTITERLDAALDWMQDNRSAMQDFNLLLRKKLELEAVVRPLIEAAGANR